MPLIKSPTQEAFTNNMSELIASSRRSGTKMNKMKGKYGPEKLRKIALAIAFDTKARAGGSKNG